MRCAPGEESARFGKAYMGSLALFGKLSRDDLRAADSTGRLLGDCMREVGADVDRIGKREPLLDARRVAAWVELHIEQGPVLVARELPVGIVTGIRGNVRHRSVATTVIYAKVDHLALRELATPWPGSPR